MEIFEIIPGRLWQSGALTSWEQCAELDINGVIDLEGGLDSVIPPSHNFLYIYWPIEDGPLPDEFTLWGLIDLVSDNLFYRKWLIHCAAGINRSSLFSALVVMGDRGLNGTNAVEWIKAKRPGALTNQTFVDYLNSMGAQ